MVRLSLCTFLLSLSMLSTATTSIYVNQVGFDPRGPKLAVVKFTDATPTPDFQIFDAASGKPEFDGHLTAPEKIPDWAPEGTFYRADFSSFHRLGKFKVVVDDVESPPFEIADHGLAKLTIPSILNYYHRQRANKPEEMNADSHVRLQGSTKTVDMHGGWCDASGDVSKYFSHLAYTNFMSPQQTPLVTWSLVNAVDSIPRQLTDWGVKDGIQSEAIWGADYMMRALSPNDYFYMIIFSFFSDDPNARRVVGLHANSVVTDEYQSAFREGGGMAIAALARISRWKKDGDFTHEQYLAGAKRAFAHLLVNNTKYDDDGKENIIDDYCALMAATELWIATDETLYRDEARKRANKLAERLDMQGFFWADDDRERPYWHASDAGMPIVALARYLDKEHDSSERARALATIKKALDYELKVTSDAPNPFGYARQTFKVRGKIQEGFFIPHENESGWWWQGENARLGSLATAAIVGGRLAYPAHGGWGVKPEIAEFASRQLSWVLGCNPYSMCFMYKFGANNVPYMHSHFGHGSETGGISNGITGREGSDDGSGIDFKTSDNGNEWRWTEQWLPHAAWFLQAVTAIEK